jgi:3-deoxy-D-manno-octulosonic acid kinase
MFNEKMTWGPVPPGFNKVADNRGNRLIVRQDRQNLIDPSLCIDTNRGEFDERYQGRRPLRAVALTGGDTALIRAYRHGGLLRHLTQDWFFTWPPRPFRELSITEELRRRGVPTVEVYGACVSPVVGPVYRGWLITKKLRDAQDLWAAVQSPFVQKEGGLTATLKAVAVTVRALHREGVYHADLNLKNILVRPEGGAVAAHVIDFDRAKLFLGHLPEGFANQNLHRLLRSIRKLDPERKYFATSAWNEFLSFYYGKPGA